MLLDIHMESRIVDLEIRYTHLERQVSELSEVVFEQQKIVDRLVGELRTLRERLGEGTVRADQDKPPHY